MKKTYAEFCSCHLKAVKLYKQLLTRDKKFQSFIRVRILLTLLTSLNLLTLLNMLNLLNLLTLLTPPTLLAVLTLLTPAGKELLGNSQLS